MEEWEKTTQMHLDNMGMGSIIKNSSVDELEILDRHPYVFEIIDPLTNIIRRISDSELLENGYKLNMEEYR